MQIGDVELMVILDDRITWYSADFRQRSSVNLG